MTKWGHLVILLLIIGSYYQLAWAQNDSREEKVGMMESKEPEAEEVEPAKEERGAPEEGWEGLSIYASMVYASRYIWRGIPLNEDSVIQPSVGISKAGFSLEVWGNIDTTNWGETDGGYGDEKWNLTEVDYMGSYSFEIDKLSFSTGFLTYTYPNTPFQSTTEIYGSLGVNVLTAPLFSIYVDVDGDMDDLAAYLNLQLSHSFALWESGEFSLGLDLSGSIGGATGECTRINFGSDDEQNWYWHDWNIALSLPFSLGKGFTITPAYSYNSLIDSELREIAEDDWHRKADNSVFSLELLWEGEL